jgi:thiosulfate reductase cytochrome b subunit
MYSTYERAWHWLQALAILVLLATGVEIHVTRIGLLDFALAVRVHNIVGFVVLANAIFAAFYHLASGEIQQYLPRPQGFFGQAISQARFYLGGIFRGEEHPFEKSREQKLNPLQQVTYLGILNVLLPLQVITGVLIWGAQRWPAVDGIFGGLVILAPLHAFGAWMFTAFLIMHVYLTTTGPTPIANIQAMVLGWEGVGSVEAKASAK